MLAKDPNLTIRLALGEQDIAAAERLRYRVFVQEMGGDGPLVDHQGQFERDQYDPYAQHLVLVDERRDAAALDHVVGVYRMIDTAGAKHAGQFYSETEYDLSVLRASGRKLLELGRSCLHSDYRGGTALYLLWNGLADYIAQNEIEVLFGVASFHGTTPGQYDAHFSYLYHNHLTPDDLRVTVRPENRLDMGLAQFEDIDRLRTMKSMPPLVKAYLRLGGFVGDGAYVDHDFNTTDVCLVMDVARLSPRQRALYSQESLPK